MKKLFFTALVSLVTVAFPLISKVLTSATRCDAACMEEIKAAIAAFGNNTNSTLQLQTEMNSDGGVKMTAVGKYIAALGNDTANKIYVADAGTAGIDSYRVHI